MFLPLAESCKETREALPFMSEAERCFLDALKQDGDYVPALLELGWFYYSVEDEAKKALPFSSKLLQLA